MGTIHSLHDARKLKSERENLEERLSRINKEFSLMDVQSTLLTAFSDRKGYEVLLPDSENDKQALEEQKEQICMNLIDFYFLEPVNRKRWTPHIITVYIPWVDYTYVLRIRMNEVNERNGHRYSVSVCSGLIERKMDELDINGGGQSGRKFIYRVHPCLPEDYVRRGACASFVKMHEPSKKCGELLDIIDIRVEDGF